MNVELATETRLWLSGGRTIMDKVTAVMLGEFSSRQEINSLPEDRQFEWFAAFCMMQLHFTETFNIGDIITAGGNDTGLDAVAILVNGMLITDVDELDAPPYKTGDLDVSFVFVQAERSPGFDVGKIGSFEFGVLDFFNDKPALPRNGAVADAAEIQAELIKRSSKFKPGNPACFLYYVTTGVWMNDIALENRRKMSEDAIKATGLFRSVSHVPIGAEAIQKLYRKSQNAVEKSFSFVNKATLPEMPGVKEAYLGYLPAKDFVKLVEDEVTHKVNTALFFDNVRDWLGSDNPVNQEISETLRSEARSRFILMNNGITIIARKLKPTGNKFDMADFTIVNGCQTSHTLFESRAYIDDSVLVPIRLISTDDEAIINDVVRATNRQTVISEDQFFALQEVAKSLEHFFAAYPENKRLYYERRTQQYQAAGVEKTRIVTQSIVVKSYAAMFMDEPHRTTRSYGAIKAKIGTDILAKNHRLDPYYTASFALYKLEFLFRNGKIDAKYKPAKFHILTAARYLISSEKMPWANSKDMEKWCNRICDYLWDGTRSEFLFIQSAKLVESASGGNLHRDHIRTEAFTKAVLAEAAKDWAEWRAKLDSVVSA